MEPKRQETKVALITSLGGALTGLLASTCCVLPIIVATIGVGTGAAGATLERFRLPLILFAYILLGIGFFLSYRKTACEEGTCSVPANVKRTRAILWVATVIATLGILFPYYIGWFF